MSRGKARYKSTSWHAICQCFLHQQEQDGQDHAFQF
jgi:hypothetical protein